MSKIHLTIVTPTTLFFDEEVDKVILRTTEGDVGILNQHTAFLSPLGIGALRVINDKIEKVGAISDGFVEVGKNGVKVITTDCIWASEIDVAKAKAKKEEIESALGSVKSIEENKYCRLQIKKQENLIRLGNK